jgi:hypothetical protein
MNLPPQSVRPSFICKPKYFTLVAQNLSTITTSHVPFVYMQPPRLLGRMCRSQVRGKWAGTAIGRTSLKVLHMRCCAVISVYTNCYHARMDVKPQITSVLKHSPTYLISKVECLLASVPHVGLERDDSAVFMAEFLAGLAPLTELPSTVQQLRNLATGELGILAHYSIMCMLGS